VRSQRGNGVQRLLEDKQLFERVNAIAERMHGPVGVATIDLTSGRVFVFNGDVEFPTASTIKIAIMSEVFRQARGRQIQPDRETSVTPDQAAGGDGKLDDRLKRGPVKLTVRELVERMIVDSDNTAANRCIAMVGMDRVNALFEQRRMRATRLRRVMMDTAAASRDDENTTSPLEMARLTEDLYRGKLGDAESTRETLDIRRRVKADVRKTVPARVPVASSPARSRA
jgi:beta-lactamase class A